MDKDTLANGIINGASKTPILCGAMPVHQMFMQSKRDVSEVLHEMKPGVLLWLS